MNHFFLALIFSLASYAFWQLDSIKHGNPSFESKPKKGGNSALHLPGRYDYGKIFFRNESPPDIHPENIWSVDMKPFDGKTYLGLSVRDNESYESVTQILSAKLIVDKCDKLSMAVAISEKSISGTRNAPTEAFNLF